MEDLTSLGRCERCGTNLPAGTVGGICVACNVAVASSVRSEITGDELTQLSPLSGSAAGLPATQRLTPGQLFGPYRVDRLLGRGGMGEVYECEHVEQGRRLALKVLNQRLASAEDRARFLREGQLAASINHPNSVYIFGSEEILGTPVIAMELLPGGTLKDRVKERGPLPPAEAVDAVLQITKGLDAANAAGVLHRDVKPANAFFDRDGSVKIGDFGLSIPSVARDVTQITTAGAFHGTPQFASPEQMRGEPLDVRADIYSVGATLYYLLTGQPPFDDGNLVALLTRVATEVPRSPRHLQPKVPHALGKIVVRCLAKDRAQRPATYSALEEELQSFGTTAPTPATLGRRFAAWIIDLILLAIPVGVLNFSFLVNGDSPPLEVVLIGHVVSVLYYGILEGSWGSTLGKRLTGLRVVGRDGHRPGVWRGLVRALIFTAPAVIITVPILAISQGRAIQYSAEHPLVGFAIAWGIYVLLACMFLTARRRNGFAGLHELASGTRVIERYAVRARPTFRAPAESAPADARSERRIGPYEVIGSLGETADGEVLVGVDRALKRRVWIHRVNAGAPALAATVRDVSRPTRLRWLSGRRAPGEAWDAYEAADGQPLLEAIDRPQPWRHVKHWLHDLAAEIDAALRDGSAGAWSTDRLWVAADGRVKWLAFRAPGTRGAAPPSSPTFEAAQSLVATVAAKAAPTVGLPLSAKGFIDRLHHGGYPSPKEMAAAAAALLQGSDEVTRWRRAAPMLFCTAFASVVVIFGALGVRMMQSVLTPEFQNLLDDLRRLTVLDPRTTDPASVTQREALEIHIVSQFKPVLVNERTWTNPATLGVIGRYRTRAEKLLADHPSVRADDSRAADETLRTYLEAQAKRRRSASLEVLMPVFVGGSLAFALGLMAALGLLWALVLRGGLFLRVFGIAVVTKSGARASRLRALWRACIVWAPAVAFVIVFFKSVPSPERGLSGVSMVSWVLGATFIVVFIVGMTWTIMRPTRGLQDRLAGTWLVPN